MKLHRCLFLVNLCTLLFMRNNVSTHRSQLLIYIYTLYRFPIYFLDALQSRVLTLIILIAYSIVLCLVSKLFIYFSFLYHSANCEIFSTVYHAMGLVKHIVYYFIYISTYNITIIYYNIQFYLTCP